MHIDKKPAMRETRGSGHRRAAWLPITALAFALRASGCGGGGGGGSAGYAVSGSVIELVGTLTLQDNVADDLSLNRSGAFRLGPAGSARTSNDVSVR